MALLRIENRLVQLLPLLSQWFPRFKEFQTAKSYSIFIVQQCKLLPSYTVGTTKRVCKARQRKAEYEEVAAALARLSNLSLFCTFPRGHRTDNLQFRTEVVLP